MMQCFLLYTIYKHHPHLSPQLNSSHIILSSSLQNPSHPHFSLYPRMPLPLFQSLEELPDTIINHHTSGIMSVLRLLCQCNHIDVIWLSSVNYHNNTKYIFSNFLLFQNQVPILRLPSIKGGWKPCKRKLVLLKLTKLGNLFIFHQENSPSVANRFIKQS